MKHLEVRLDVQTALQTRYLLPTLEYSSLGNNASLNKCQQPNASSSILFFTFYQSLLFFLFTLLIFSPDDPDRVTQSGQEASPFIHLYPQPDLRYSSVTIPVPPEIGSVCAPVVPCI